MKILVTGGLGFIGSNAVDYFLENGHTVCVVDKCTYAANKIDWAGVNVYKVDISTCSWSYILNQENPDVIVSTAAETHVDNSITSATEFLQANITGVYKIVQGVQQYNKLHNKNILFCHISTDEVYGDIDIDSNREFHEFDPLKPNNPYSATKAAADLLIAAMHHTYKDFDYLICRASNNYGPRQHLEKFLPTVISSVLLGKKIPVYGTGSNVREWLWVKDFCSGILAAIKQYMQFPEQFESGSRVLNFSSNVRKRNIDVVKEVLNLMNKDDSLISYVPDRPGHDRKYAVNSTLARSFLGWNPQMLFLDGLCIVVDDIEKRLKNKP